MGKLQVQIEVALTRLLHENNREHCLYSGLFYREGWGILHDGRIYSQPAARKTDA
jgi:hypothetical protein